MAETDVHISGWGGPGLPQFATEETLKQLVAAFGASGAFKGLKKEDIDTLASAIQSGDSQQINSLLKLVRQNETGDKKLVDKISETNKRISDLRETNRKNEKGRDADAEDTKKLLGEFSGMMANIRDGLNTGELGFGDMVSNMGTALAALGGPAGKAATALTGIATAVAGANSFFVGIGEDRYNLANEVRQSGLAASLTVAESGMMNFSKMVTDTSFTLGQAGQLIRDFSQAVGGAGIKRSMQFIEEMAYGGAEGADMMRRFGMNFDQVTNVAGNYLESMRNLGTLDRMNDLQLRSGMEEFMDTVTVASNIMKIKLEDAAEMIANTLNQRDDLTVMLAGLPEELRQRVTGIVAAMGAQGTEFGNSISMALASVNFDEFLTTEQGQALAGSNLGQEFIPLLRSVTDQIRSGADQGQVLAAMEGPLRAIVDQFGADGFRALIAQNADPMIRALGADMVRILDNIGDADAGNRANTNLQGLEDDRAFNDREMVQQRFQIAAQQVLDNLAEATNYAENLTQRNATNMELISTFGEMGAGLAAALGDDIADVTFGAEDLFKRAGNMVGQFGNAIGDFISDDFATARAIVREQNRQAMEMLGIDPATIERENQAEEDRIREEIRQQNIETTVGDTAFTQRREFNEDIIRAALNQGNEIVDYETTNAQGETIIEKRINTNLAGGFGVAEYMPVTQAQLEQILSENEARTAMLEQAPSIGVTDRFANRIMTALTRGDAVDNADDIAELISGIDNTWSDLDIDSQETVAQLEFIKQAIESLETRNAIDETTTNRLITAIENLNMDTGLRTDSSVAGEQSELRELAAALRQLVRGLNQ